MLVLNTNEQPHNYLLSNEKLEVYPDFDSILGYINGGSDVTFTASNNSSSTTTFVYGIEGMAGNIGGTLVDKYLGKIEKLRANVGNLNDGSLIGGNNFFRLILNSEMSKSHMKATKTRRFVIDGYLEAGSLIGKRIIRRPIIYIGKSSFTNTGGNVTINCVGKVKIGLLHNNGIIDYITGDETFFEFSRTSTSYGAGYDYINSVLKFISENNGVVSSNGDMIVIDLTLSGEYTMLGSTSTRGAINVLYISIYSGYFGDSVDYQSIYDNNNNGSSGNFPAPVKRFKPRPIQISIDN